MSDTFNFVMVWNPLTIICFVRMAGIVFKMTSLQYENTRQMLIPATLIGLTYSAIINSNQNFLIAAGCLLLSGIIGATGIESYYVLLISATKIVLQNFIN